MVQFVFGMLTMFAVVSIIAIVIGIVKIYRLSQRVDSMDRHIEDSIQHLHQRIDSNSTDISREFDETRRDLSIRIEGLNSYVDSRFDKVLSKIK